MFRICTCESCYCPGRNSGAVDVELSTDLVYSVIVNQSLDREVENVISEFSVLFHVRTKPLGLGFQNVLICLIGRRRRHSSEKFFKVYKVLEDPYFDNL